MCPLSSNPAITGTVSIDVKAEAGLFLIGK